jgi:hypothetical protein
MTRSEFAETLRQAAELLSTLADIVEKRCRQRFLRYRKQGAWDRLVRRGGTCACESPRDFGPKNISAPL